MVATSDYYVGSQSVLSLFKNRAATLKRQTNTPKSTCLADNPFVKFSSHITGRQLFEREKKDQINTLASIRKNEMDGGSHAGFYQEVLKEMWDDEKDTENYEERAKNLKGDIYE